MAHQRVTRRRFVAGTLAGGAGPSEAGASLAGIALRHDARTAAAPKQTATDSMIAIADVTMIDTTGAPPRPHTTVVIEGNRIAEIRPAETAQDLEGMRVVDGALCGSPSTSDRRRWQRCLTLPASSASSSPPATPIRTRGTHPARNPALDRPCHNTRTVW